VFGVPPSGGISYEIEWITFRYYRLKAELQTCPFAVFDVRKARAGWPEIGF
jgi:hypothetical protein